MRRCFARKPRDQHGTFGSLHGRQRWWRECLLAGIRTRDSVSSGGDVRFRLIVSRPGRVLSSRRRWRPLNQGGLEVAVYCATRPNVCLVRSATAYVACCGTVSVRSSAVAGVEYSRGGFGRPGLRCRAASARFFRGYLLRSVRRHLVGGESGRLVAGAGSVAAWGERADWASQPSGLGSCRLLDFAVAPHGDDLPNSPFAGGCPSRRRSSRTASCAGSATYRACVDEVLGGAPDAGWRVVLVGAGGLSSEPPGSGWAGSRGAVQDRVASGSGRGVPDRGRVRSGLGVPPERSPEPSVGTVPGSCSRHHRG